MFGKNTTAGAINITSKEPSYTPEGTLELNYGNYNTEQIRASERRTLRRATIHGDVGSDGRTSRKETRVEHQPAEQTPGPVVGGRLRPHTSRPFSGPGIMKSSGARDV